MSAVCLKIMTILCLSGTAMSDPGSSGVVWREIGGDVTIQCRPPQKEQDSLALKKGLYMKSDVFNRHGKSEKVTIAKDFQDRLQFNGLFPNMDILIKNVTSKDTDTYWCVYKKVEVSSPVTENGEGSILLVVTEPQTDSSVPQCDQSNNNLILVLVVIGAAVLLGIIICFLVWIFRKTKSLRSAKKPRRVATNDVYEDMRGTIRG